MRKIANKIVELKKDNEEISNFLEAIPDWDDYYQNELEKINQIESKPLAADPRSKDASHDDDYFVFNFISKLKGSKKKNENNDDNNNDNEEEEEEEDGEEKVTTEEIQLDD